jgi:outer membrane protein assembly factor BamB
VGWVLPTYRHDSARSGITSDNVDLVTLKQVWIHQSKFPPQPAWLGPARRDGWHKVDNLKPKMVFDWAFHVVIDEKSVYFGSSADDQVYCLNAEDGKVRWKFFTEAPIRFAPTIYSGKVYVGSDDGLVYCVSAENGQEIWRYEADPGGYRLPGNGRMISISPIRSGILVGDEVAYFCAGIFSFNNAFLCAVGARNGDLIWQEKMSGFSPQGYLLSSSEQLYVQNSRGNPFVFRRAMVSIFILLVVVEGLLP